MDEPTTTNTKAGRRLSKRQLDRLAEARQTIDELVRWANYEDAEPPEPDADAKALYAVKALGADRIGGYAVLWGDRTRKDLTGEYFTPQTADLVNILKAVGRLPVLYHHAMDGAAQTTVIAVADTMREDEVGLWYEAQLDMANKYRQAVGDLIYKAALGTSSGTLPGARQVAPDGAITRWPIVELSLTPTPAEPRMLARPVAEIKAIYDAAGLATAWLPADVTEGPCAERTTDRPEQPDAGAEDAQPDTPAATNSIELERERLTVLALGGTYHESE